MREIKWIVEHCSATPLTATIAAIQRYWREKTDDRTTAQKDELYFTLKALQFMYPNAVIRGHRDFPNVAKACPRYDARKWFEAYIPFKK
jgi:hypothetical protein